MTATLMTDLTVEEICKGFAYNEVEGKELSAATDAANCQMLCKTHNRAKGNR